MAVEPVDAHCTHKQKINTNNRNINISECSKQKKKRNVDVNNNMHHEIDKAKKIINNQLFNKDTKLIKKKKNKKKQVWDIINII